MLHQDLAAIAISKRLFKITSQTRMLLLHNELSGSVAGGNVQLLSYPERQGPPVSQPSNMIKHSQLDTS
eukprot:scaffold223553_cov14-Tisochrysis_lutea.AAC.1